MMLQTELSLPFSKFGKLPEHDEFSEAVDHLFVLAKVIENHVMRQHGRLPLSAGYIISFIEQMCDAINIALVAIGKEKLEV